MEEAVASTVFSAQLNALGWIQQPEHWDDLPVLMGADRNPVCLGPVEGGKKASWWPQDHFGLNFGLPGVREGTEKGRRLDGSRR